MIKHITINENNDIIALKNKDHNKGEIPERRYCMSGQSGEEMEEKSSSTKE